MALFHCVILQTSSVVHFARVIPSNTMHLTHVKCRGKWLKSGVIIRFVRSLCFQNPQFRTRCVCSLANKEFLVAGFIGC